MINNKKKLFYSFIVLIFNFTFALYNKSGSNQFITFAESQSSFKLEINSKPYITRNSLGADLYTEGLAVKFNSELIDDYALSIGYDKFNLGEQKLTIEYSSEQVSFSVFVTNEFALVGDFIKRDLFISKVLWNDGIIGIELFNATNKVIDLNDYKLELESEEEKELIRFDGFSLETKQPFTISFDDKINADCSQELMLKEMVSSIKLLKDDLRHDLWESSFLTMTNGNLETIVINRHPSILSNNDKGNTREWFNHYDLSKFGHHVINENVVSYQEQARAFARYVMFGAGMFAQGRVEEAFLALRTEFELMHEESIAYFIQNGNEKVRGINEEGIDVEVSFKTAHERIGVLADRSGYSSFITTSRTKPFTIPNFFLIIILIILSLCGYTLLLLVTKYKRKQNYDKINLLL